MKKFLVSLFALVLVFTLAACATADEPLEEPQDDIPAVAEESSPTDEEPSEEDELSESEDTPPADEESPNSEEPALPESSPIPTEDDTEVTDNTFKNTSNTLDTEAAGNTLSAGFRTQITATLQSPGNHTGCSR